MKNGLIAQNKPTSIGNDDWSHSAFSSDALAALWFGTRATALDTLQSGAALDIGFTDGVTQGAAAATAADASATPGTRSSVSNTAAYIRILTNGTRNATAALLSSITGGFRLNNTAVSGNGELVGAAILGGADGQYSVSENLFSGSPNADQTTNHGAGGIPDAAIVISTRLTAYDANQSSYLTTIGFWTQAGMVGFGIQEQISTIPTNVAAILRTGDVGSMIASTPAVNNTVTISGVGATQYTISTGGGGNNAAVKIIWLRGASGPLSVSAGIHTSPTSNSTSAIASGMATAPSLGFFIPTRLTGATLASDDTAGSWGFGVAVNDRGTTSQYCAAASIKDAATPSSVGKSMFASKAITILDNAGAVAVQAGIQWDAAGASGVYSTTNGAALKIGYLLIGAPASNSATSPGKGALSITGQAPSIVNKQQTVSPAVGTISVLGNQPNVFDGVLRPGVASLQVSQLVPTVNQISGPTTGEMFPATLTLQGLAPTLITQRTISPLLPSGDGFENDLRPTVLTEWTAKPAQAQLTLAGTQPRLVTDGSARVSPGVAQLTLQGFDLFIASAANPSLQPSRANLDLIGLAPDVIVNWIISPADPDAPIQVIGLQPTLRGKLSWHAPGMSGTVEWHTPA